MPKLLQNVEGNNETEVPEENENTSETETDSSESENENDEADSKNRRFRPRNESPNSKRVCTSYTVWYLNSTKYRTD
jgi:hypothetical protein